LSNLKIMKNRRHCHFNVINVLFGTIMEAKVSGHHSCGLYGSWNYIFCFRMTFLFSNTSDQALMIIKITCY